jgi:uncharacterized protein YaaQ
MRYVDPGSTAPWVAPAYVPALGNGTPNVGAVAPSSGGGSSSSGSSSSPAYAPTTQQFQDWIVNSPEYKQGIENLTTGSQRELARENAMFALTSQRGGGGGGYSDQTVPQSFYDEIALQKEKAAHDYALQQKALPELMAARGMLSSGQTGFQAGENQYSYDTLLKDIELQKKAREESVAQANAAGHRAASAAASNNMINQQIAALQHQYAVEDINLGIPAQRDKVLQSVSTYYHDMWWNGSQYVGPTL